MSRERHTPDADRLKAVAAHLRIIAKTLSLAEAQREARLALRLLGEEDDG